MSNTVEILLSVFNGERYLQEQLDSIVMQSYKSWRLVVRDDASDDSSYSILQKFKSKFPDKVKIIDELNRVNIGPAKSYERLINSADSQYIMFCDQDDVWISNKIEKMLFQMKKLENENSFDMPFIVYSDMKVCAENLSVISDSFFSHNKLNPVNNGLKNILFQNNIPGCSMMINFALKKMAIPFPQDIIMHDWWLNLCVNINGKAKFIPEPLLLYRQHSNNYYGAYNRNNVIYKYFGLKKYRATLKLILLQIRHLYEGYGSEFPEKEKKMIHELVNISDKNIFIRKMIIIKYARFSISYIKVFFMCLFI
jgi:glycosyltransferase involved in cell wall biosynthesis